MDSRFKIKVTFSIYGREYPWEASLNWFAPDGGVDDRIVEFFRDSYEDAKLAFDRDTDLRLDEAKEAQERAQLARLKSKYPDAPTPN